MSNAENKEYLESMLWFRLSKVAYFISFIAALMLVSLVAYTERPTSSTYTDNDKTIIHCNNGKAYNAKTSGFFLSELSEVSATEDKLLKILCEYDVSIIRDTALASQFKNRIPQILNYKVEFIKTTNEYGSWTDVLMILIFGFALVILIFEVIKRVFLYITVAKNPLSF